jgi:glycosyltransferase involved in cell wall biosynthesis
MKIAIDVTRAVIENAGIGRYTLEVAKSMIKQGNCHDFIIYSTHFRDSHEKIKRFNSFRSTNAKLKRLRIPGKVKEIAWGVKVDWLNSFLEGSDVLFAPSFFEVGLGFKVNQVVTIHDMTTFLFPHQRGEALSRYLSKRTLEATAQAKWIICVSESTKRDLIKFNPESSDRSVVIYPGKKVFSRKKGKLPNGLRKGSYILTVGTIEPRKNLIGLVRAYKNLSADLKKRFPLVIAGGKGWNNDKIYREFKSGDLKPYLVLAGFVSDGQLARLYQDCCIFAYPSFYEGFGLPIVEAQSFGIPVLTSDVSSLPEAGGEGALYVDPNDTEEITKGLEKLLIDDSLRKDLSRKALLNANKFSWEEAAKQTLSILEKACDKN